jgi:hypothetical protein
VQADRYVIPLGAPSYSVQPLEESTWPAFAALAERNNGIFGVAAAALAGALDRTLGRARQSRWTVPGSKAGTQTEMYSAPSAPGVL